MCHTQSQLELWWWFYSDKDSKGVTKWLGLIGLRFDLQCVYAETAFATVFTCHKIRQFAALFFARSSHLSGLHAAASALTRWIAPASRSVFKHSMELSNRV